MKKVLYLILLAISCCGCESAFDVRAVYFTKEGGTQTISSSTYTLSIHDANAQYGKGYYDEERQTECVEYDWLSAEMECQTGKITITAKPNDTGKKRRLFLSGMHADIGCSIPVIQGR